ncbi:hypothetical protein TNCV_4380481 [Trichonephila clavipes]|nr:hypothetical protein TNCV_4380481 [Trichonephila clavipes]
MHCPTYAEGVIGNVSGLPDFSLCNGQIVMTWRQSMDWKTSSFSLTVHDVAFQQVNSIFLVIIVRHRMHCPTYAEGVIGNVSGLPDFSFCNGQIVMTWRQSMDWKTSSFSLTVHDVAFQQVNSIFLVIIVRHRMLFQSLTTEGRNHYRKFCPEAPSKDPRC